MPPSRLRRLIAVEAARLIFERSERQYVAAKRKAVAGLGLRGRCSPEDLPSNREIKLELEVLAREPRESSPEDPLGEAFDAAQWVPPRDESDRYLVWALLLPPLELVKQEPHRHPEGDALYHSLQAFQIAQDRYPYDEEMMVAALLHDVGKAIDPADHVEAALLALDGTLTPRETFLIAHHMDALAYRHGKLPHRQRMTLQSSEWFEDLMALRQIDDDARSRGVAVCSIDEALETLKRMADEE